jgi:hypothetical protein
LAGAEMALTVPPPVNVILVRFPAAMDVFRIMSPELIMDETEKLKVPEFTKISPIIVIEPVPDNDVHG